MPTQTCCCPACRPYLFTVPEDMAQYEALFSALGVPPTPTLDQYRHGLAGLASQAGGKPLGEEQLALAIALAEGASAALLAGQVQWWRERGAGQVGSQ